MPGRSYASQTGYRYGFNGKETDKDMNSLKVYDYGFRIYNPAIGKFLSVDPLTKSYPWNSTYAFAENDVIRSIDLDGLEKEVNTTYWHKPANGSQVITITNNNFQGNYIGYKPKTYKERLAEMFINSNYMGPNHGIPLDGEFSFVEFEENPNENYAIYSYWKDEKYCERRFDALELQYMADLYDETVDQFEKDKNLVLTTVGAALTIAGLPEGSAESKAASGETKALKKEIKSTTEETKTFYRGTKSMEQPFSMSLADLKQSVDKDTGLMKERGVSINLDKNNKYVQQYGGAWEVDVKSIPAGLKIVHTSGTHYEIAPAQGGTISPGQYIELLKQVKVKPYNKIN